MKKTIYILMTLTLIVGCGIIEKSRLMRHSEKRVQGVGISLLDDYKFNNEENQVYFENDKVFMSDVIHDEYYFHYIFWKDGRCLYSTAREKKDRSLGSVLNNKEGTAGYYKIINDTVWTEFYSDRTFIYHYFKLKDGVMQQIGQKARKPFKNKMRNSSLYYLKRFEEKYTQSGSDSVYFNQDSVALWKPFW